MLDEKSSGGLSVGARDCRQLQFAGGKTVKGRSQIGQRYAGVLNNHAGDARIFFLPLRHHYRSASVYGLPNEFVAVGFFAAQRNKQIIFLHTPRVIRMPATGRSGEPMTWRIEVAPRRVLSCMSGHHPETRRSTLGRIG